MIMENELIEIEASALERFNGMLIEIIKLTVKHTSDSNGEMLDEPWNQRSQLYSVSPKTHALLLTHFDKLGTLPLNVLIDLVLCCSNSIIVEQVCSNMKLSYLPGVMRYSRSNPDLIIRCGDYDTMEWIKSDNIIVPFRVEIESIIKLWNNCRIDMLKQSAIAISLLHTLNLKNVYFNLHPALRFEMTMMALEYKMIPVYRPFPHVRGSGLVSVL